MTVISAEELLRGRLAQIRRAAVPQTRIRAYYWFSCTLEYLGGFSSILPYDAHAEAYFQTLLERKLHPGTQDLKIAAIALKYHATLVTRNCRDFERIPELKIEDWSISK